MHQRMSTDKVAVLAPPPSSPPKPAQNNTSTGLTSDEAKARLEKDGPNAMADISAHLLRNALAKFWAPAPGHPRPRSCFSWYYIRISKP